MAWVKLDDQYFHNRKARSVGPDGRELFLASVCYAAMQLNDGTFVVEDVPVMVALAQVSAGVADRLVSNDLWHQEGADCPKCRAVGQVMPVPSGHITVHEYLKDNPSRARVLSERSAARDRMAKKRSAARSPELRENTGRSSPSPSRPVPNTNSVSRRLVTHDANGERPDDDELSTGGVPNETWDAYAELKLRQQGNVKNPGPWKRSTATNARTELGEQAQRWWHDYVLTPRRLAECLLDGQIRNVQRRTT